jgi:hypothetical protein
MDQGRPMPNGPGAVSGDARAPIAQDAATVEPNDRNLAQRRRTRHCSNSVRLQSYIHRPDEPVNMPARDPTRTSSAPRPVGLQSTLRRDSGRLAGTDEALIVLRTAGPQGAQVRTTSIPRLGANQLCCRASHSKNLASSRDCGCGNLQQSLKSVHRSCWTTAKAKHATPSGRQRLRRREKLQGRPTAACRGGRASRGG